MNNHKQATLGALLLAGLCGGATAQSLPPPPASPVPVVNYEYDAEGNPTKTVQAPGVPSFNFETRASYDSLQRRKDTTDAKTGITRFGYDGLDRTVQVTDPRNLVTQYPRTGLGDTKQLVSPDTGTSTMTYDAAGNVKSITDSRGVKVGYNYDALNRVTAASWSLTGQTTISHVWQWDQAGVPNGNGRVGMTTFPGGSWRYTYDAQGRVLTNLQQLAAATGANPAQILHTVTYGYDGASNIISITYPSGRKVAIIHTAGQPSAITLAATANGTAVTLINGIQWQPFGAATSWNWQTATGPRAHQRIFDTSGRLVRYPLGTHVRDLGYDAADRIGSYTHYDAATGAAAPSLDQGFGYDELGRLKQVTLASGSWGFDYDANGNRTVTTVNGSTSNLTIAATSNRITSITNPSRSFVYDNTGNTTADGLFNATYDLTGRMNTLTKAGVMTTYTYDSLGRRIRKFSSTGVASTVVFFYDQNGQLLGEYDSTGKAIREYVWLGSTPVAVFTPDPANAANPPLAYFIHADHIDTPRVVMDKNNAVRWKWLSEPFGVNVPEANPSGLGNFTLNLRFPGQYFDQESGLHYNFFRDYDPGTGRYDQSDPIGLKGGINTYSYVGANPLTFVDPQGLAAAGAVLGGRIGSAAGSRLGPAGAALGQAAGAAVGSWVEDACDCPGGYVHIYRVVGSAEHAEISSLQQYSILANGFGQKQFWLRMSDAAWFVQAEARMQPSVVRTNRYIVSSSICNDNLRRGFPFSDVGHNAISFDAGGLTIVNRDANMTGGIRTLRTIAAQS